MVVDRAHKKINQPKSRAELNCCSNVLEINKLVRGRERLELLPDCNRTPYTIFEDQSLFAFNVLAVAVTYRSLLRKPSPQSSHIPSALLTPPSFRYDYEYEVPRLRDIFDLAQQEQTSLHRSCTSWIPAI